MRARTTGTLAFALVLGLVSLSETMARAQARAVPSPDVHVQGHPPAHGHTWGFRGHNPPIPRTYSYIYNYNFNQPRHFRVIGPDGRKSWRTTVRGLPLGTPWPSF